MGAFLTFIDTSAIVARLANEPKAGDFARRISGAQVRFTSGLVILETSMRLSTLLDVDPVLVESRIRLLLAEAEISIVPIDGRIATASVLAIAAYGERTGPSGPTQFCRLHVLCILQGSRHAAAFQRQRLLENRYRDCMMTLRNQRVGTGTSPR